MKAYLFTLFFAILLFLFHYAQTLEAEFFRQKEEQREFYCQTSSSDDVYVAGSGGGDGSGGAAMGVQNGGPSNAHNAQRQVSHPPSSPDVDGAGIY